MFCLSSHDGMKRSAYKKLINWWGKYWKYYVFSSIIGEYDELWTCGANELWAPILS